MTRRGPGWLAVLALFTLSTCTGAVGSRGVEPPPPAETVTRLATDRKILYLTFDLCGGRGGGDLDGSLLGFLEQHRVPASIFLTKAWGDSNGAGLLRIRTNGLFRVENHGTRHRCLSSNGIGVYGLPATRDGAELQDEIQAASDFISNKTGRTPAWFRAAGLAADAMGLQAVADRRMRTAGCAIALDEGATASAERMARLAKGAQAGDIILVHLNHPERPVSPGFQKAYDYWVKEGFSFSSLP